MNLEVPLLIPNSKHSRVYINSTCAVIKLSKYSLYIRLIQCCHYSQSVHKLLGKHVSLLLPLTMRFAFILAVSSIASTALAAPAVESGSPMVAIEHQGLSKPSNKTEVQEPKGGNQTQCIKNKNLRIMPLGGTYLIYLNHFF